MSAKSKSVTSLFIFEKKTRHFLPWRLKLLSFYGFSIFDAQIFRLILSHSNSFISGEFFVLPTSGGVSTPHIWCLLEYSTLSIKWEFDKMGIWTPSGGLEVSLIIHGKMGIRYTKAKSGNFENGTLVFHSKMGIYPQNSCSGVAKWDPILSRGYCTPIAFGTRLLCEFLTDFNNFGCFEK